MKSLRGLIFILFYVIVNLPAIAQEENYEPEHLFSVEELKNDFQFLRTDLEKMHPNLYLYTSKPVFNLYFDSLYKTIDKPLTEREFYDYIVLLNSKIRDGHTMFLPDENGTAYFNKNGKFFPFCILYRNNKMYVTMNCSSDTTIEEGSEIISINGTGTKKISDHLLARQIRDGNNQTYPVWILDNYFKEYFSFSYGHPESFLITYKNNNNRSQTITIPALSKDSIKFYEDKKYPYRMLNGSSPGIFTEINNNTRTGILTIKTFDNDILSATYSQSFKSAIDSAFLKIQSENITTLILDLRNNQGGDFENGQLLLSYLLNKPFQLLLKGDAVNVCQPNKNCYKQKLYVLINGGSFSNTGIVCSRLQFYKRAVFIGEETGGNKNIISGYASEVVLPNTKIRCEISTTGFVIRQFTNNNGHGTFPDYYILSAISDIVENKDTVERFACNLINGK